ncbi:MAG TPA: response regulator [Gemmataceae bacterium]|nr:response regulator [Gemmataceae bacterium]
MPPIDDTVETILIVDDEESVRKTFREWLDGAGLDCRILAAADAEAALVQANELAPDLAILDWNLGAGNDGLRLLEDLYLFNPNIIAIMITGFAHQATPLDAMRMGVRDYLDKNQDLDRGTFLTAVYRQLERIRPAKREQRLHRSLVAFREAVEKVLPLVQSASALNDPVPLPDAIRTLMRFLLDSTGARDGVLLIRSHDAERHPAEDYRAYTAAGDAIPAELVPFARSIAGTVVSLQEPYAMNGLDQMTVTGSMELQPFEHGRQSLLAAPMAVAPGIQAVLELFDKKTADKAHVEFSKEDHRLIAAAADFGTEMLRQALAERQTRQILFDAVAAALGASDTVAQSLEGNARKRQEQPPPTAVLEQLRKGLGANPASAVEADETLRLVEAIRVLALRHGPAAVSHCIRLVESLRDLLDSATGAGDPRL